MKHRYNRGIYFLMAVMVMGLGLLSRRMTQYIPDIINVFLGDFLWALMVYFFVRAFFIRLSISKAMFLGILFCFTIEVSQLYHVEWIENVRRTTLGGLVLGYGFLWSDLVAYLLGISFGYGSDVFNKKYVRRKI